jgi:site-specific DNA recombinase
MSRTLQAVPAATAQSRAIIYVRVSTKDQLQGEGDPDGYSIPAQREACLKRAESLGAHVADVFVERGESARSTDRPELQRMLAYLASEPVEYVIVHKVDRLARNRLDDVTITAQIQAAGAQLVSVTENIDETPSGTLLHGIMSSIAEFYSRNLANEVIKGTQQKVSAGGTPHVAPIGYLNVRRITDGSESRTIAVDAERAEHIRWAFVTYATGDYSLNRLAAELETRGLTQRPTPKRAARPLPANKLHDVLTNRYYIGLVTWRGVEYPGKHPVYVSAETFEEVQRVLVAHRQSGERSYRHQHFLAGTVFCARCKSRLLYNVATGRRGDRYDYFMCAGRHSGRTGCDLPYVPVDQVTDAVARQWEAETFHSEVAEQLTSNLMRDLTKFETNRAAERDILTERIAATKRERYKWADKAMEGVVPADIAREKQQQLASQLLAGESALERLTRDRDGQRETLLALLSLLDKCNQLYVRGDDKLQRDFNRAWFEGLDIDVDEDQRTEVVAVRRNDITQALAVQRQGSLTAALALNDKRRHDRSHGGGASTELVGVSNVALLVGDEGLEPPTLSV